MAKNEKAIKVNEVDPGGRPTKFTPQRCADIVDAIKHRAPYEYAAMANGISERTLYNWIDLGKEHLEHNIESNYAKFLQDIKRAELTRIREHTDIIAARPERWQADAWLLERRWHKHFGPNAQLNELNQRLERLENGEERDPTEGAS